VPPLDAGYVMVSLGNYRGFYNSAWIGGMVANCVPFFTLIGFYLVNYAVRRDFDTGVGQILATTQITRVQYFSGKLISNFAVLLVILMVIAVMTVVMFFFRGETSQLELEKLLLPLVLLTIPAMLILASIALFFDSFTNLNQGLINILYFIIWTFFIASSLVSPYLDIFGMNVFMTEIKNILPEVHPDWDGDFGMGLLIRDSISENKVFIWEGMNWTNSILLNRLLWVVASFGLVLLATIGFNRFDPTKIRERKQRIPLAVAKKKTPRSEYNITRNHVKLEDLPVPEYRFNFINLLLAEIRMLVRGNSTLWMISTSILFLLCLFTPISFAYKIALPLLWLFQILVLSGIGSREINNRTNEYIFSSAYPLQRQLPATITAAALFMLVLALPIILRLLVIGNLYGIYSIIAGALFIPVFAITLGIISRGSKLFEVLFTVIIYGYFNRVPYLDLFGAIEESKEIGIANYLMLISLLLVIVAFSTRGRQVSHS
jgi:hypothetical protein